VTRPSPPFVVTVTPGFGPASDMTVIAAAPPTVTPDRAVVCVRLVPSSVTVAVPPAARTTATVPSASVNVSDRAGAPVPTVTSIASRVRASQVSTATGMGRTTRRANDKGRLDRTDMKTSVFEQ